MFGPGTNGNKNAKSNVEKNVERGLFGRLDYEEIMLPDG